MATRKSATKKAGVKANQRSRRTRTTEGEVEHSPIIITDGSASVELSRTAYTHIGGGTHTSSGINLQRVEARRNPSSPAPDHICHTFVGAAIHRVEVVCVVGAQRTDITVTGANTGANRSPIVQFDRGGHFNENAGFPPKHPTRGRRFSNGNARIISLRVIRVSTGEIVHDCPFVTSGGFEYTICDGHCQ